jgi:TRAP-type C4-dicarboxylate transport system permease small subunit
MVIRWFGNAINWLTAAGGNIAAYSVLAMTLIVTGDVIARWLFGSPTPWAMESAGYLLVIATPMALAYTLKVGGHIRVPILVNRLPEAVQHWLRVVTSILGLGYCGILSQLTWKQALASVKFGTTSGTSIDVILWPFQMVIPLGLSLISLLLVLNIYNETRVALGKVKESKEVESEAEF